LTAGSAQSFSDLADILGECLRREVTYVRQNAAEALSARRDSGLSSWKLDLLADFDEVLARGIGGFTSPIVEHVLGRQPRTLHAYVAEVLGGTLRDGTAPAS